MSLLTLLPGAHNDILVMPRWPSKQVLVDELTWQKLQAAQASLPAHLGLLLTRAYEPAVTELGRARTVFRRMGIWLFGMLYPHRKDEIDDIFGSNGHDLDGTHIDVSITIHGRRVRLLPLSVFTPISWQARRIKKFNADLVLVQTALAAQGFQLHRNATESLQIHCDLKPVLQ
ncbi:hypothetical protein ACO0LF_06130 [Undibacterium sp. Di27W]|uniref:hypothetical protein n=1 Tax=Undibacterium sp. Di27W TaxID=3413036 RepID=UPI003BF0A355